MVVWSGGDGGFSFSPSDSLFLSLWFSLSNWMWVLVLLWIFVVGMNARFMVAAVGVVVLFMEMGSLWVYIGCYKCGWRFGGCGTVGVPILSLKLGLSLGSILNFCCGYLSLIIVLYMFLLVWMLRKWNKREENLEFLFSGQPCCWWKNMKNNYF